MLTPNQLELIKATIPVLRESGVALTTHFYARMMKGNPELMQVFNQGHQRAGRQQEALAGAVLAYAENIEHPEVLAAAVRHIANKHVSVGIRAEHYPIVGRHLLASIQEVLGEAATPELIDAWGAAYGMLADILINTENALYMDRANVEGGWTGWRKFKVADKKSETADVTSFTFVPVEGGTVVAAKPGQYVSVRVYVESEDLVQPRQYTVSGCDNGSLRISVKRCRANGDLPAGMVSNTLHDNVNVGDLVELTAPVGEFTLEEAGNANVVLISAGIGITPMLAMLRAAVKDANRQVHFVHICRNEQDFALAQEVNALVAGATNAKLTVVYTDQTGRPTVDFLKSLAQADAHHFICGPEPMMAVVAESLRAAGVDADKVHAEKFGTGALSL